MENSAVTYHRLIVDGLRYFNRISIEDIERMDIVTYNLYMEAAQLALEDRRYEINMQSFANQQAKATKKSGDPYYKDFEMFYGKTNKKNIRSIEKRYFPEKFAAETAERLERAKQFTQSDFELLNKLKKGQKDG